MNIKEAIEDLESILKNMELNHKTNVILYNDDKEAFETIVKYFKDKSISNINIEKKIKDKIESNKQSLIGMKKSDLKRLITYENEVLKSLLEEDSMSIEEDLKILQEFTELDRKLRNYKVESDYDNFCERRCVAIDHILAEREADKKKIAELEAKLEFYQWGDLDNLKFEEYMKEFIPKQKVKEILIEIQEEYNKLDKEIDKQIKDKNKDYYKCKENIAIMQTLAYCRDKFEELLEDK